MKKIFIIFLIALMTINVGFAHPKASFIQTQYPIAVQLIFPDLRKTSISDIEKYVTSAFFKTTIVEELNDLPNLPPQGLGWFDRWYSNDVILSKTTPSGDILYLRQGDCVRIFYVYFDTSVTVQKKK